MNYLASSARQICYSFFDLAVDGEANNAQNSLLLENGLKFLDDCSIHVQFSKLI